MSIAAPHPPLPSVPAVPPPAVRPAPRSPDGQGGERRVAPSYAVGPRLSAEWARLSRRPSAIRHAESWGITGPLRDLDELLALAGLAVASTPATDEVLRALVVLARHDQLAGRVVVQRILPGLLVIARARSSRLGRRAAASLEELIGATWIVIAEFDQDRRPACLAAALLSSADHLTFRSASRRLSATEVPVDTSVIDDMPAEICPAAFEELAEIVAEAVRSGTGPADLEFLRRLVRTETACQLASDLGVTSRTVRNRRDAVIYRLRRVALAA